MKTNKKNNPLSTKGVKPLKPMAQPSATTSVNDSLKRMKQFPLTRQNFYFMAISAAIIILGFLLMLGGSSTPEAFNPDIFSTRRIVVGPTIAFIGFILMGLAIIYKPGSKRQDKE